MKVQYCGSVDLTMLWRLINEIEIIKIRSILI